MLGHAKDLLSLLRKGIVDVGQVLQVYLTAVVLYLLLHCMQTALLWLVSVQYFLFGKCLAFKDWTLDYHWKVW